MSNKDKKLFVIRGDRGWSADDDLGKALQKVIQGQIVKKMSPAIEEFVKDLVSNEGYDKCDFTNGLSDAFRDNYYVRELCDQDVEGYIMQNRAYSSTLSQAKDALIALNERLSDLNVSGSSDDLAAFYAIFADLQNLLIEWSDNE